MNPPLEIKVPTNLQQELMTLDTGQRFKTVGVLEFLPDGRSIVAVNEDSLFMWRAPLLEDIQARTSE